MRSEFRIPHDHNAVMALTPILRQSNALEAAWAFMLVQKVLNDSVFILPDAGADVDRVVRFFLDTGHADALVLLPTAQWRNATLLAAVDLLIFVPQIGLGAECTEIVRQVPTPLLLSDVLALHHLFSARDNCYWCKPNDPKDAARVMLRVLEEM
ncbi:MAG: hypothetical protein AB7N71_07185 [Phycisphaerae bacterium]